MRVCLVTPYDLSHDGGANRHVRSLARALSGLGCEAHVFGPASGLVPEGCRAVSGATVIRCSNRSSESTTLIESTRSQYSVRQSSSVASFTPCAEKWLSPTLIAKRLRSRWH